MGECVCAPTRNGFVHVNKQKKNENKKKNKRKTNEKQMKNK
jgi:hypothetical protein